MKNGSEYQKEYRVRRRALATSYLGGKCVVCGTTENLQFDHKDPITKVLEISNAIVECWSWKRLATELDKCQLLCSDHHIEKSQQEGSLGGLPWNKVINPKHGTAVMYASPHKCRCEECRAWKHNYRSGLVDAENNAVEAH